MNIKNTDSAAI